MTSSEYSEQVGFINWFREHYPSVLIFHIPNGEYRSPSVATRLKKAGVVPGIPDLYIPKYRCWIEFKRSDGGVISKTQSDIHQYLIRIGDIVIVAHGANAASRKVLDVINKV